MFQDLRQALRTMLRRPGFAVTAIVILALGNGATTAVFSVAHGVMLRDLPYPQSEQLVALRTSGPRGPRALASAGAADYFDWRRRQQVFEDLAITRPVGSFNLTGDGEPERLQGARTTASLFSTLRAAPLLGRTFTEAEQLDPQLAGQVAVLGHGLWMRRFGGDPSIVGRTIQLNGKPCQIVGVMGPEFRYPARDFEIWAPLYLPPEALRQRQDFSYLAVARLKANVTVPQAAAHMEALAANLAREHPATNRDVGVEVAPLLAALTAPVSKALWALLGAVGTLFLIGCANLANLSLVRAAGRSREFAIRAALGATRVRLARQFLVEMLPVAAAGAGLGLLAARWLLDLLLPLLPAGLPRLEQIGLDGPVLLFSTLLSVAAALLTAIAPALGVSASVQRGPAGRSRLREALVVGEIAGTAVLLVGAGLLIRSFANLAATEPGFRPDATLSLHLAVSRAKHGDDAGVARYLGRLVERVRTVPGVEAVGIVNRLPLSGQGQTYDILFEGQERPVDVDTRSINGDYFRSLGIPLLAGRTFTDSELPDRPAAGIIDARLAREVFGSASPVGKRFRIAAAGLDAPWVEIVGVAGHLRHEGLDRDRRAQVYWPYAQRTQDRVAMTVRTPLPPAQLIPAVRAAIREVDADQPIHDVRTMREVVERTLAGDKLSSLLVATFAALALLLASVGLYGVVSQLSARRRREFGIRMALGASEVQVLGLVLRKGMALGLAGLALGLVLALVVTRVVTALLHGVGPLDLVTYAGVVGLLGAVVLVASAIPARRAMKLEPAEALRAE